MNEEDQLTLGDPGDDRLGQPPVNDAAAESVDGGTSEQSAAETASARGRGSDRTLYYLTNRMNLNGILSSRLISPRSSFQKYYADLLRETPGWVPLLRNAPTSAQIEAVTSERGSGGPVLVELTLDVIGKAKAKAHAPVVYVPAVALSDAVAVHFPSERDLREYRARGYSNIHPHDELLRVTPELFEPSASDRMVLSPPSPEPAVDWVRVDRVRGAISAAFASAGSGEQLTLVAALVGATRLPPTVSLPSWFGWLDLDDHADPDSRPHPDPTQPDHVGFRAAYDVLGDQDAAEKWSPNEVLDAVENCVREAGLADDAANMMERNLSRVRSILNFEVDFEPFRPSAQALVSAKALLLVLLRPELDQLLAWPDNETGADDATRVLAAVLSGRLRGLSRESTKLRSLALDDLTASWAVRVARGETASLGKVRLLSNRRGTSVKIDGFEIASQSALLPDLPSKYQKIAESKKEALRIRVSRAMGWPVQHRVLLPSDSAVEASDSLITIIASNEVVMEAAVDEGEFVRRLESLRGDERRHVAEVFAARR